MFSEASVKIVIGGMVVLDNAKSIESLYFLVPSMGRLLTHALRA